MINTDITDEAVYVRAHGERGWSVCRGAELLLVTTDGEEAFEAGCKASGCSDAGPLILLSGPSSRPPEGLLRQIEQRLERPRPVPGRVGDLAVGAA